MDMRIAAVQIAQRLLCSPRPRFKNKPAMVSGRELGPGHGQAKLEGHIKAWGTGRSPIQLNTREIVNRIPATLYKRQYPIQAALASGDSEGSARLKTDVSQADDVGKIKAAKGFVVRNVHEDSIWLNWRWHACSSYLARKPSRRLAVQTAFRRRFGCACVRPVCPTRPYAALRSCKTRCL